MSFFLAEVEVGKDQEFTVNTKGAGGQGNVGVKMTSPSGRPIPCKLESDKAKGTHSVKYIPPEEGQYKVDVSYDGNPVMGSPFGVEAVMPADPSKVNVIKVHSADTWSSKNIRFYILCFSIEVYNTTPDIWHNCCITGASFWPRPEGRHCG